MATKVITPLTSLVGKAHPTIKAIHPITQLVYPVYQDLASNGAVSAFSIIKGGEILGPFADPYTARDEAQRRILLDIEKGISNP